MKKEYLSEKPLIILYESDTFEALKNIVIKFDLLLTDPPYGILNNQWDKINLIEFTTRWWASVKKKLKENSSAFIFWSQKYLKYGLNIFEPKRTLIWHHPNLCIPTNKMFLYSYDPIFYITFGTPKFNALFGKQHNVDVLQYAKPQTNYTKNKKLHFCQKPLELLKHLICLSTDEDDFILDLFAGSGSTALASYELNRNCILIENDHSSCEVIKRSLKQIQKQMRLF